MAINEGKAFDVNQNGFALRDGAGSVLYYFTTGVGLPYGNQAPLNTFYVNQNDNEMWVKHNTGVNDWRVFDAFGKPFVIARLNGTFGTTSATYVDALTQTITGIPQGKYVLHWSYRSNNSNSGTINQTEPRMNGFALLTNSVDGKQDALGGGAGEQFSGFADLDFNAGNLTVSLAIRKTSGGGTAYASSINLYAYRIRTPF